MKNELSNFIISALSKLDKTTAILLIPVAVLLYIILYIPNETLNEIFGAPKTEIKMTKHKCPNCDTTLIYNPEDNKLMIK